MMTMMNLFSSNGLYVNPGYDNFEKFQNQDYYVDKTGIISVMNKYITKGRKYLCISKPRRFGKSSIANMLSAYYSRGCDSKEIFNKYSVSDNPSYLENINKYNVLLIDIGAEFYSVSNKETFIKSLTKKIKVEVLNQFSGIDLSEIFSLADIIAQVYKYTGIPWVIIMDEYDIVIRDSTDPKIIESYVEFLSGVFKNSTLSPAIALAYLTGILPIIRSKVQSKLNNFDEFTMLYPDELSSYFGFTSEEVAVLCERNSVNYDVIKQWYDGYHINNVCLFNPRSVVEAIENNDIRNYWGTTSSYRVITDKLSMNFDGLRDGVVDMLSGSSVDVDISGYLNDGNNFSNKDDVLTYLIHIGYLSYDKTEKSCRIPNLEVAGEWRRAINKMPDYEKTNEIIDASKQLLASTIAGDTNGIAKALDESHIHVTSNRSYNNEDGLQCAIYLAYMYALNKYIVVREMTAGKGFADLVYIPLGFEDPALIIELKRNDCTESALNQIKEKRYFDSLSSYNGDIIFVGINYNEVTKQHSCSIERFVK